MPDTAARTTDLAPKLVALLSRRSQGIAYWQREIAKLEAKHGREGAAAKGN